MIQGEDMQYIDDGACSISDFMSRSSSRVAYICIHNV